MPLPQPSTEPSKIIVPPPANSVAGSPDTTAPAITADPDHLPVAATVTEYGTTQRPPASQAPFPNETPAYRAALPLWRGEPFADLSDSSRLHPERTRLRNRYNAAAVRAGELLLAAGALDDASDAARCAIAAEPSAEPAYQLLARAHLAQDDVVGARRVVDDCRATLADLGLEPDPTTIALVTGGSDGQAGRG